MGTGQNQMLNANTLFKYKYTQWSTTFLTLCACEEYCFSCNVQCACAKYSVPCACYSSKRTFDLFPLLVTKTIDTYIIA